MLSWVYMLDGVVHAGCAGVVKGLVSRVVWEGNVLSLGLAPVV